MLSAEKTENPGASWLANTIDFQPSCIERRAASHFLREHISVIEMMPQQRDTGRADCPTMNGIG